MKTIFTSLIILIFTSINLYGQDPVNLCAQVDQNGQDVEVNIYVDNFTNIIGVQFGVAWELSKYTFESFENIHPSLSSTEYSNATDDTPNLPDQVGLFRLVWVDLNLVPVELTDGSLIGTLKLTQKDAAVSGLIGIAPTEDFEIEFISEEGNLIPNEIEGPDCSVLAFATLTSNKNIIQNKLMVSPNPIQNEVTISLEEASTGSISIYALTGKLMEQFTFSNKQEVRLSLESLEPGSYILTQKSEKGKVLGQSKIVKL